MKNENLKKPLILISFAILAYFLVNRFENVIGFFNFVISLLSPVFIGIGIAFVINLLVRFYEINLIGKLPEKKISAKVKKIKRPLSMIFSYITALAIVVIIVNFIIPKISISIKALTVSLPEYMNQIGLFFHNLTKNHNFTNQLWEQVINNIDKVISNTSQVLNVALPQLFNITKGLTSGVINIFLGFVFSVYMLASKEKLLSILKKTVYAICEKEKADRIIVLSARANKIFRSFVGGQLIESTILGVLCFLGMTLFKMPYAPLVSVLVGITSLVPVLGSYVGVIISALLILLESPVMALWFVVFIVILQQIEGNLIYPRVVGNAIGLDGIWVLLAVTVGGSLFGVLGILLGVPVMAVIYTVVKENINSALERKNINI